MKLILVLSFLLLAGCECGCKQKSKKTTGPQPIQSIKGTDSCQK